MFLVTFILGLTALVNAVMILIVINMSTLYRRAVYPFIYSALMVILWTAGTGLLVNIPSHEIFNISSLLFLIAPLFVMLYLFIFMSRFPTENGSSKTLRSIVIITTSIATLFSLVFHQHIIWSTLDQSGEVTVQVSQILYGIYATAFMIYSLLISRVLSTKLKLTKSNIKRAQIGFIYLGATVSSLLAFFTNLLLPFIGITDYIWLGPVFTLLYAAGYTFAIRQYRLFEIRLFASRAIAYVGSLAALLAVYIFGATLVRAGLQRYFQTSLDSDLFYAFVMLVAIVIYPFVKRIFDTITRQIFFHKDYDIQDLMDKLGDILLRAKSRQDISKNIVRLFSEYLLASKVTIVYDKESSQARKMLDKLGVAHDGNILDMTDTRLEEDTEEWIRDNNVALVAPIQTHSYDIGWLLFSGKRNGDPYSTKDKRAINIAADEIAIGLENAIQYEQIDEFNDVLKQNIADATIKLRVSNKKLRDLDHTKDEFISMASHQLRTPLTSVKGYLSMVLEGDVGEVNPQQRKLLEEAFASSQRMVYLIGDFLNVSRIQTGKFELERSKVSLPGIILEEISQLKATAKSRGIELAYDAPTDFPMMNIDENKIRQVMMNFIDNAIYYSKPHTTITVSLGRFADRIEFKVVDHGIGVPREAQHHLFTKFYRADNAKLQRPDGTGIGLFMAKKVIVEHEGAIMFESTEGKGSMFGFRLPLQ